MNLSDSFYVALCMTVLILGVVYWFWTQNQYIQRKLNLLENIVYEMKSSMSHGYGGGAPDPISSVLEEAAKADAAAAAGAPSSIDDDADSVDAALDAFNLGQNSTDAVEETPAKVEESDAVEMTHLPHFEPEATIGTSLVADELFEDLTPGGITASAGEDVSDTNNESVLNGMGLKELRELAKQKGVANPKNLRKHELVAAIRASKTSVTPFEIREGTLELN